MNKRNEKKEYMKIVNEIDTILFGKPIKKSFSKFEFQDVAMGFLGSVCGVTVVNWIYDDGKLNLIELIIGIICGIGGTILSSKYNDRYNNLISMYENAYLKADRSDQLKVLELAKKLSLAIKEELVFKQNIKYFELCLGQNADLNMFDSFEANHPHFEIFSQEKIDEIHAKGKLTPPEKFREWMHNGVCSPASPGRCKEFGNCRDCLVDYAIQQDEWKPLSFKPISLFDTINNEDNSITDLTVEDKSRTLKK